MIKLADTADLPCLDLTSHSTRIKRQDQGKWHVSAIGRLKMGRTAETKEIQRYDNRKGSTSAFLHYLCVDDFSKLDWDCVGAEQLLVTNFAVRYDRSWALFSAKQDEVFRVAYASDMPSDRGYIDLPSGLTVHHTLIQADEIVPGLSSLSDRIRRTFNNVGGERVLGAQPVVRGLRHPSRGWGGEAGRAPGVPHRGSTFVEVQRGDAGWDFGASSSHCLAESLMEVENVITFMLVLGIEMSDNDHGSWVHDTHDDDYDWEEFANRQYVGPRLGVLAWEPGTCDISEG